MENVEISLLDVWEMEVVEFYQQLVQVDCWLVCTALLLLCIILLPVIRQFNEGIGYNIAMSSFIGDMGVITHITAGFWLLNHAESGMLLWTDDVLPEWAVSWWYGLAAVMSIPLTMWALGGFRKLAAVAVYRLADRYHDLFVGPMLVSMSLVTLPVVVEDGWALLVSVPGFGVWLWCVWADMKANRMDQWPYLTQFFQKRSEG